MAMVKDTLKATIKALLTTTVIPKIIDANGDAIDDPNPSNAVVVSPSDKLLNAITEIVPFIQSSAEVAGPITITGASGGLVAGVGGGVPGPVTASLTGAAPVAGVVTIPPTGIK